MDIALLDYGTGNLHTLCRALEATGARVRIDADLPTALAADAIVLPGVGSFAAAAEQIAGGLAALRGALSAGMPCLGICVGMQLLFQASEEGPGQGIGLFQGSARRLAGPRVPHTGWNDVEPADDPLFAGLERPLVYFANSYAVVADSPREVVAWTEYGEARFPAAVHTAATWGLQFRPEKSGTTGLRILTNFVAQWSR